MSTKYVPIAALWYDRPSDFLSRTVHEQERKPVDTGLLDANGVKLFRVEDKPPVGFIRPKG